MDTRPFTNTSRQGLSINVAATNVPTQQTTNDTMNEHNVSQGTQVVHRASGHSTHDAKLSKKRKFEEVGSDDIYRQSIESSKKTPKLDHSRTTPQSQQKPNKELVDPSPNPQLQQESNDQVTDSSPTPLLPQAPNKEVANSAQILPPEQETNDEDAEHSSEEEEEEEGVVNFNLPSYSLAYRGRLNENSGIIYQTWEPNDNATLVAIIECTINNVFACNLRVQIEGIDRSWVG
jgi:hypothetical protein